LSGCIFAIKPRIDNRKKLVKQQYLLQMSPQYCELGPLAAEIGPVVANFNGFRVMQLTAAISLSGSQPHFARCLSVSWAGTLNIHFAGSCPIMELCQVQNSLCIVQVLRTHILVALLHGTWAVGTSQTFWRWAQGATYIWQGNHHAGHWPTF